MTTIDLDKRLTLTRKEAALAMGVGVKTIDRMRADGKLPSFLEYHTRLFPVAGVREYIKRRAEAESQAGVA